MITTKAGRAKPPEARPARRGAVVAARTPSAGLLPATWFAALAVAMVGLCVVSMVVGVQIGSVHIPAGTVVDVVWAKTVGATDSSIASHLVQIVWDLRVPRVALAALVGAGLSVVGVAVQALVRNPIADPYVLGVSSGASIGAAAVIVYGGATGLGMLGLSGAAFTTACLSMAVVYLVARRGGTLNPLRLVLTGVVAGYILSALTSYLVFLGDPRGAQQVLFWLLGSFGRARWSMLAVPAVVLLVVLVWLLVRARPMDALLAGDEAAVTLGVPVARVRVELFIATAALTAVMVSVSGAVGFVGLVVPHIVRLVVGGLHRRVLIASVLFGAIFMVWVDLAARTLASPQEIPIGILTAIIGGPLFLFLMYRSDRRRAAL
ncbi:iron ABC transporter permease [Mycolicibacterium sp. S2-37]|uniref:FecCD family ABC transporter permease n=1 Tax=Mycolicibacterium sp. S2-37 TaxID=2810297 RepID=UPI001A94A395|nr:iron ABC transporter permease [Mycolicibacterium sp. S2-37]MBO0680844.1 iron ABC transporter permease [Mycolicibacterium sp. S2-37]